MPTLPPQLFLPHLYLLSKVALLLLVLATTRYLLILFTQLATRHDHDSKGKEQMDPDNMVRKLRTIFHALMAWLYFIFLLCGLALPIQMLSEFTVKTALPLSCLLFCLCGELIPRVLLNFYHTPSCLSKWDWLLKLAHIIDRLIPLNGLLLQLFKGHKVRQGEGFLTRDNVHRMLGYVGEGKAVRQEEVELLDKMRMLEGVGVAAVMVPRTNIFVQDSSAPLNARLITRLSRYYFSKFLLYSHHEDNVIGYLQFKQLLAYTPNQRIIDQPSVIRRDLVQISEDDCLSTAFEKMIATKINFALVRGRKGELVGLVKLKDIFSRVLLKWYNYGGLTTEQTIHSIGSFGRVTLEEAEEQN